VPELSTSRPLAVRDVAGVRITAHADAIDAAVWPQQAIVVRIAPDDVFVIDASLDDAAQVGQRDPHAIIEDESLFCAAWVDAEQLHRIEDMLEWPLPDTRPALAQGMAAGLAIKLWLDVDRTLLIISKSVLHEMAERFGPIVTGQAIG
jgi:hypothetical protein